MNAKKMTAAELMSQIQNNQNYQKTIKEKEEKFKEFEELLKKDELPIIQSLNKVGISVTSVWDLVNTKKSYSLAIPILIEHIKKPYHLRIKAGIARTLAVPEAKELAWDVLLSEYEKAVPDENIDDPNKKGYKDGLALAISFLADEIILKLVKDKKHGASRVFFIEKLYNFKTNEDVIAGINNLKKDTDLSKMIKEKFKIK